MLTDTIKTAYLEEIRFAKLQQWAVTVAAITLIAGAFHMAHTVKQPLAIWEKVVATIAVTGVAGGGIWLLFKLQRHLRDTRKVIDHFDRTAWRRGLEVVVPLKIALYLSAAAVCYSFWRDDAYHLLLRMQGQVW